MKSLIKREEAEDKRGISSTYSRLSSVVLGLKDIARARLFSDKSHETVYGTPSKQYAAMAQFNLGLIEEAAGQRKAALAAFQKSLALRQDLAEKRGAAKSMEAIAKVELTVGNEKEAAGIFGAADALRTLADAPMSPTEQKRYGVLILDVRKKFPQEWNAGRQRVLEEVIAV